ncbi:MAG: SPFH domain-containing protein [Atopobiaceae bacterium]|jgi:regulator of protease activity HflC (stomatin/prohibitin superfamily)|nr:SPFH domain-containing protein [Atopobiaceae bacterium]
MLFRYLFDSVGFVVLLLLALFVMMQVAYVVRQQHVAVIERLGRFHGFASPGLHFRIPFVDRVFYIDLKTEDEHMTFDAKTSDNVTIELDVSIQYHVDSSNMDQREASGVYKSYYMLQDPVAQMQDYLADALRSQIPNRTLDEVFSEKDAIAHAIDEVVAHKMLEYGYVLVTTLITRIKLPLEVQESMNHIIASKNNLESATNDANAARAKTVIAAQAKAEAMAAEGKGIADQRIAIARGIKDSIDVIQGSNLTAEEANRLFEFTQWVDMMRGFAEKGSSSVVLPSDFRESQSMFEQMVAAKSAPMPEAEPREPHRLHAHDDTGNGNHRSH